MFNVVWFLKLRLNDTFFIHLKKIANTHTSYHDVQTEFFRKKKQKSKEKNYVCIQHTTAKPRRYHFLPYISVNENLINKASERNIKLNQLTNISERVKNSQIV